tara:strand:- start:469 stop:1020 length:552 start_codon:yes stop_codon:yes gene_type:complete
MSDTKTNVACCERTIHLVEVDSGQEVKSGETRAALVEHLTHIGWTTEKDFDKEGRQALRDGFALRFTQEVQDLLANENAKGSDTAAGYTGGHFTNGKKKSAKNQAHWEGQITSGINKWAKSIEAAKVKAESGQASNTARDIFTRVADEIAKLKTAVTKAIEKEEDEVIQTSMQAMLENLKAVK